MYLVRTIHAPGVPIEEFPDNINEVREFHEVIAALQELEKDKLGKFIFQSEDTALFQTSTDHIYKYVDMGK